MWETVMKERGCLFLKEKINLILSMHPLKKLLVFAPYFHYTLVVIKTVLPVKLKFEMKMN